MELILFQVTLQLQQNLAATVDNQTDKRNLVRFCAKNENLKSKYSPHHYHLPSTYQN